MISPGKSQSTYNGYVFNRKYFIRARYVNGISYAAIRANPWLYNRNMQISQALLSAIRTFKRAGISVGTKINPHYPVLVMDFRSVSVR